MLRKLSYAGFILAAFLPQAIQLRAQEAAFISGDQAIRFEQSAGFFHYAALCRTPTAYSAQPPLSRLPREATESAICWYVKASRVRGAGTSEASPLVDGKLVISEHHIRFLPHDPASASLYVDLPPQDSELHHDPGQSFGSFGTRDVVYNFRFSKLCLDCAPGTPIPAGAKPELLDEEFALVQNSFKQFHVGWKQIYELSSKLRIEVRPQNQPTVSDPAGAMRLYAEINRQVAELCPESSKACVRSYATYEACQSFSSNKSCGEAPTCSAICGISLSALPYLKAHACVQLDRQTASLIPDWSELIHSGPADHTSATPTPGLVEVQLAGSAPPATLGCSVQASYLRASASSRDTTPLARAAGTTPPLPASKSAHSIAPAVQPAPVALAKPAPEKPRVLVASKPIAPVSPIPNPIPAAKPKTTAVAQPVSSPGAKPAPIVSAKSSANSSRLASARPAVPTTRQPAPSAAPALAASATTPVPLSSRAPKSSASALKLPSEAADQMVVRKVPPIYPLEAKVARVQGTVVLNATIDKTGKVSAIDVVSGPELLQSAAMDAVKQWEYRPFSFNGQALEVETTIHVKFGYSAAPARR